MYRRVSGFFSDISYTLYLVHLPLAVFICAFLDNPWHFYSLSFTSVGIFVLINIAIVIAAYGFYRMFEGNTGKIRRLLNTKAIETGVIELSLEEPKAQARFG
jgi:peptidoglycan/LPS O-acetylase OafA/YrhL